jgi:hypothetical protein
VSDNMPQSQFVETVESWVKSTPGYAGDYELQHLLGECEKVKSGTKEDLEKCLDKLAALGYHVLH